MKSFKPILSILTIAIFTFMAVASGDDAEAAEDVASADAEFKVSAEEILDEYEANKVSASQKYGSKVIEITGILESTELDMFTDKPYLMIGKGDDYDIRNIRADLAEGVDVSGVQAGSSVTVKGKVDDNSVYDVGLAGCIIK